ncbi:hypothetical protein ACIOK4_13490 [Streptomyces bottropensis]|uniref:hypothetical protein n=1 Tax=Streptomyces bottropensis TaxID=42235 RepID=UPI00380F6D12
MSNYQYVGVLGDNATIGPETVNGTGQVYIQADELCFLSNGEARELGRALIEAADYAKAVQDEKANWPGGRPPKSVLDVAWTDPAWRVAGSEGDPDTRCGDAYRPDSQSTSPRSVARCTRGLGHVGMHVGCDFDGAPHQWEPTP